MATAITMPARRISSNSDGDARRETAPSAAATPPSSSARPTSASSSALTMVSSSSRQSAEPTAAISPSPSPAPVAVPSLDEDDSDDVAAATSSAKSRYRTASHSAPQPTSRPAPSTDAAASSDTDSSDETATTASSVVTEATDSSSSSSSTPTTTTTKNKLNDSIANASSQPPAAKKQRKTRPGSLNREILLLNNDSVIYLQMGNPMESLKLLTEASSLLNGLFERQKGTKHVAHQSYKYNWVDFADSMNNCLPSRCSSRNTSNSNEGCIPYLFLRALKISKTCHHENFDSMCYCGDLEESCPCGIAWVVWYNLAIACTLLGCRLGEKGYRYLDRAYHLYEIVRGRILSQAPSKDWSTLLLAVFNNQSCIYHEYSMHDEASACLVKMKNVLARMPHYRDGADW
eukprot:CAMPEP_0119549058 /NCGR_PEP_ID=MMETSP1352-20130426/2845_1 /TAXON_ID=265584 /ORGANISM="Stauroneis constricta, Strain CCMP1120" /LENGTH=402 /DNA_ID=CAMNT_0007594503 /DNA_START=356 /DNA_END=1561 /DNA_ORIENTATION=+